MSRTLLASLATLTLVGCGSTSTTVTSSVELDTIEGAGAVAQAQAALKSRQQAGEEFVARGAILDDNGDSHVRFDRRFQGLRVLGGDFVSHQNANGALRELTHAGPESLQGLSVKPSLSAARATQLAERAFVGKRDAGAASAELVVFARGEKPVAAYEVVLEGVKDDGTPSILHVVVDAHTGAVLETADEIETAATTSTGNSLYVGTVSLATNSTSTGYEMRDPSRGKGFYTLNLANGTSGGSVFTSTTSSFGNGTTSNAASAGVDAHYGIQKTYDYFKNVHGRDGIDGAGGTGYNRVHYSSRYNNAFWSDSCFCMTYGDGDGTTFTPLTAIDVAGHEMTHGVTSRTARLVYSGESGGLNEATSDIFGSMVEYYAASASDPGDYLIGEKIYTPSKSGDALRYMANPSQDGKSVNCWSSSVGSLDVHYSSGVANHFFYLLAEGSTGSTTCNGSTLSGIGRSAAEKIWYRALTVYMTSSTKYAGARTATLNAAKDLFGSGSTQYNAVAAAWSAVSVN
ncbi:putative neutral zinc metalloprotease [Cystobacter fuscus DSM 2262]|uniref:Neutral metalloproteinase n=1 Tax=Cystobacter fuscus (strain ATCC 25194 / DSM 2262 / NBRC 100088 / M29) TaxID=1242864 RepID=S9NTF3_CYSF2|nr:M4 family metallopeptidase [Cystobacter fuscus]EPX55420.1 putative neutral zinc metalloprotease [Cystobacter fuscus DSM 2262]